MERTLDARPIIRIEVANALHNVVKLGAGQLFTAEYDFIFNEARGGDAPEVKDDFEQIVAVVRLFHSVADVRREHVEQGVQIICDFKLRHKFYLKMSRVRDK
jgi:hypothetical protein